MTQWGTAEQRFWKSVDATGGLDACWLWMAYRDQDGYGRLAYGKQRTYYAHRLSLILAGVEVPTGKLALHSCDNPPCVNPAHLRLGTAGDNLRDMFARDRQPAHLRPWTHCKRGHEVAGENAMSNGSNPHPRCRTCAYAVRRARKARQLDKLPRGSSGAGRPLG